MAEAEEVLTDAARHATVFAQRLWRRYQGPPPITPTTTLADIAERLDLLITALLDEHFALRTAQAPPRPTLLARLFGRAPRPRCRTPVPGTDGRHLWLPPDLRPADMAQAATFYRVMALQQAVRAVRGSATQLPADLPPPQAALYLICEARAADKALVSLMPGMVDAVQALRRWALAHRPALGEFSPARRLLEGVLRRVLAERCDALDADLPLGQSPAESLDLARSLAAELGLDRFPMRAFGDRPLLPDWWTGELLPDRARPDDNLALPEGLDEPPAPSPQSARLFRRPDVREARDDEDDDADSGAWMIQADEPHPYAEDPMGLNRPVDRNDADAEEYGEMVSELAQARLVATPGTPREVLISDDPPPGRTRVAAPATAADAGLHYPEWDYRLDGYRLPGATVRVLPPEQGSRQWVEATLASYGPLLEQISRRFEMLQATRQWQRRQADGEEIDLDAYVAAYADQHGGGALAESLYRSQRRRERSLAITLLVDASGSTDSWVVANRRVIDVEREALLLVAIALQRLGEPYAIQAFSGAGPGAVTLRELKGFSEPYGEEVALRISSLEPEQYTRTGAAIRHACAGLMRQPANHRLLLLLSDGKPSDRDEYEGRYGVEDMRQAVIEATLQGISPFCLTIDRQGTAYLPRIFGAQRYALLPRPELLPTVLLDWMRRLITQGG